MKKVYWRPTKVSRGVLILIAIFSIFCLFLVEKVRVQVKQPYYEEKIAASQLAFKAFKAVKHHSKNLGIPIDLESDPSASGLVGQLVTSITSNSGHLDSKQTTINPNFSAIVIDLLKKAKLQKGDTIAVGLSGSFPALNINIYAAIQTLGLKPIVISSASASQWGANNPQFSWLDMEKYLFDKEIFSFRSIAASLGGIEDRGLGITKTGKKILSAVIEKNGVQFIDAPDFQHNLDERMALYGFHSQQSKIRAYINVGGGTISVGRYEGKTLYKPGLNKTMPVGGTSIDSIMTRFNKIGVPVIHFTRVNGLAKKYGLPIAPLEIPSIGEGEIYYRHEYNNWLASTLLVVIVFILYGFIRSDLGYRIIQTVQKDKGPSSRPKQMV